ncbi:MAG: sigma 54-interacting transcriptional regulator [Desulfovibrionaceae bacterium]
MALSLQNLQLKVLAAISQIIDKALDLEESLHEVLRILSETLSMKRATITLAERETGQLVITASHGLTKDEKARGVYRFDEGVTGRIFRTASPYFVPDITKEPLFLDKTGARKIEKDRLSFIGVPILLHGAPIGVLNVDRLFTDDVPPDEDIAFLTVVATLIAQFISLNDQFRAKVRSLEQENVSLKLRVSKESKGPYIVGRSIAMLEVEKQMQRVAPTKATILLLGESGTGKTLIARIIRDISDRKHFPFVKVNCASIPDNLLESELFGHEKGAFTGATSSKPGRFEEADKGTIFLDEIGELSMGLQAKLLRVLQEKEFERLGSNRTRTVDVRIITATNRDLAQLVESGGFREDLFYRLSVFPIHVPPLRERKEDVVGLLTHFLGQVNREYGRALTLAPEALGLLRRYDWPGNVREMENLIERVAIMADGDCITDEHIRPYLGGESCRDALCEFPNAPRPETLKDVERNEVVRALRQNGWIQYKAAEALGLTPRQMGYRVRKFNLEPLIATERAKERNGN